MSSKSKQTAKRIAIQGYEGSFHQMAAEHYVSKDTEVIPCATFRELVRIAADSSNSDGGFMAIENSIAGSILPNYSLLEKSRLRISGEIYLLIDQYLLVVPGTNLEEIKEVHSHPMALLQCMDFLEKFPDWKLIETADTALSAKNISQENSRNIAVIASRLAADLFNLQIKAAKIQTHKNNYTRFLYLQRDDSGVAIEGADKASIHFQTDHTRGSLARVLQKIAAADINLSKIQSLPIVGKEWKYSFHADLEFATVHQFEKAVKQITPLVDKLRVFGVYKKGETVM